MSAMMTFDHLLEIGLLGSSSPSLSCAAPALVRAASPASKPTPAAQKSAASSAQCSTVKLAVQSPPSAPITVKSEAELSKMSKEERKAYHQARLAAEQATKADSGQQQQQQDLGKLTKAQRRAVQEAQRKAKEDKTQSTGEFDELLKDLKLQGLSEDQAREVILAMSNNDIAEDDEDDDEADTEDLLGSVRRWMSDQDKVTKDALNDFNLKVRFQGHVDTTPPDHLRALLLVIIEQACEGFDLSVARLQPTSVAKQLEPLVTRWAPLLEPLYNKIDDALTAADVVVGSVSEAMVARQGVSEAGQACGLVGCLMAIREIDMIEDDDLLTGCRRSENRSKVMDKFIEFLEQELEEDDEDDD